jgi:hypothetical protein
MKGLMSNCHNAERKDQMMILASYNERNSDTIRKRYRCLTSQINRQSWQRLALISTGHCSCNDLLGFYMS